MMLPLSFAAGLLAACSGDDGENGGLTEPQVGAVAGEVRNNAGAGIANVALKLTRSGEADRDATTGVNGTFLFQDLSVGSWSLGYTVPAGYTQPNGQSNPVAVMVGANQTTTIPPIVLNVAVPSGTVQAQVREAGAAVAGVGIQVRSPVGATVATGTTASNGNANVTVAVGEYNVTYTMPSGYEADDDATTKPVSVSEGQTSTVTFAVRKLPPPSAITITITDNAFNPNLATVAVGGTVTWRNQGGAQHTTTRTGSGAWDSGGLNPGQQYQRTFTQAGTFSYECVLHPGMTGAVVVAD